MKIDPNLIDQTELTNICRKMVQTPSVNGHHPEKNIAKLVAEIADSFGLEVELLALEAERPNVLVHIGPPAETALVLIGHLDTVPTGDESAWSYPPFGGEIVNERLYGRGAIDTKGGMAAALGALRLLNDHYQDQMTKRVTFIGVPDEESGATGRLGVSFLHQINKLSGKGAIYVYPDMDRINIGHRGIWRFKLTARGKSLHTGSLEWQNAPKGYNALTGTAEILNNLEALKMEGQNDYPFFEGMNTVLTPTTFEAGQSHGIVPDFAEAVVDVRLVPAVPKEVVVSAVDQVVKSVCLKRVPLDVTIETLIDMPSTILPESADVVVQLQSAAGEITSQRPKLVVSGPANESYLLNGMGIPTCTFGPVGKGAHAADEYVELDSLRDAAAVYALTALNMIAA